MKDIIEEDKESKFISGIHNYCDAWCDRCAFTEKCIISPAQDEYFDTPEKKDINNKEFWDAMGKVFADTLKMVAEKCEEMGIDINFTPEEMEEYAEKEERKRKKTKNKIVPKMAQKYSDMITEWFEKEKDTLADKAETMNSLHAAGIDSSDIVIEGAYLEDAIEVIYWYQHFIYVKFMRAMLRDDDEFENSDVKDAIDYDSNGSAKIALIGIDRSISAWGSLQKRLPERSDDILDILVHLERLRKKAETEFPNARKFKRPGFDNADNSF